MPLKIKVDAGFLLMKHQEGSAASIFSGALFDQGLILNPPLQLNPNFSSCSALWGCCVFRLKGLIIALLKLEEFRHD